MVIIYSSPSLSPSNLQLDDYYAFEPSALGTIPTRIPLSLFNPGLDLIRDIVRPSGDVAKFGRGSRPEPAVELSSAKSGLKLVFDTNRMFSRLAKGRFIHVKKQNKV